ncbi:isoprene synthase [Ranunculus cassubicifolius]
MTSSELTVRPLNNYKPSYWSHEDLTKILRNQFKDEAYSTSAAALQDSVRHLLNVLYVVKDPIASLELIEDIQRLGLGYIFQNDIHGLLSSLIQSKVETGDNLYATSLYFRLLGSYASV